MWFSAIEVEKTRKKKCKQRIPCEKTDFGCCLDKKTVALGPFQKGEFLFFVWMIMTKLSIFYVIIK